VRPGEGRRIRKRGYLALISLFLVDLIA